MSVTTRGIFLALFLVALPASAFAVSYAPKADDIVLNPGEDGAVTFSFFHNEGTEQAFFIELVSASVGDGPENVVFSSLDPEVGSWLSLSDATFVLPPGDVKEVTLSVSLPEDAPSGVDVIALQVIERHTENDMIGATTGVSPLIFLSVGELPASAELKTFSASTNVTDALPVSFLVDIENTGLRVVKPEGEIVLRNMFGEVIEVLEVNPNEHRVISEVTRTFMVDWGQPVRKQGFFDRLTHEVSHFTIGWIAAEVSVTPWEGGEALQEQITLFFFPWRTLLFLTIAVAVLLGLFRVAKR